MSTRTRWPYLAGQDRDDALMTINEALNKAYSALENVTRPDGPNIELFQLQVMGIIASLMTAISELNRLMTESPDEAFIQAVNEQLDAELKFMIQMLENGASPDLLTIALKHRRETLAIGPNGGKSTSQTEAKQGV